MQERDIVNMIKQEAFLEEEMNKKSAGERIFSEQSMMRNRDKERTIEIWAGASDFRRTTAFHSPFSEESE
jgi:hypothetical protein